MKEVKIVLAIVLIAASAVSAVELQLVEDFELHANGTNAIDDVATAGGGGTWDTESNGTGNVKTYGSSNMVLRVIGYSAGQDRGAMVHDLANTIENTEVGTAFFRFKSESSSEENRQFLGVHHYTGSNASNSNTNHGEFVTAGFGLVDHNGDKAGAVMDIITTGDNPVVLGQLNQNQWYNVWIVADNANDLFDLYIAPVSGPGTGAPTVPTEADLIAVGIPFGVSTDQPLTGMMFLNDDSTNPAGTRTTDLTIDDLYWNGDERLAGMRAVLDSPANGKPGVLVTGPLSWLAPDDPNIVQVISYDVYLDPNEALVAAGDPSVLADTVTAATYDPALNYDTKYFWRVDAKVVRDDDINQDGIVYAGGVWSFSTETAAASIDQQPQSLVLDEGDTATFEVVVSTLTPESYQWSKSTDGLTFIDIADATDSTLVISGVTAAADEAFYRCAVNNESEIEVLTDTASLTIGRPMAHWTLDADKFDAVNDQYLDSLGMYPAALQDPNATPQFVEGKIGDASAFPAGTAGDAGTWNPSEISDQLTISCWVKWDGSALGTYGNTIILKRDSWASDGMMWQLIIRDIDGSTGNAGIRFYNASGLDEWPRSVIEPDKWAHVCATFGGGIGSVYINGILAGTDETGALGTGFASSLVVGSNDFPGAIDDIQVFNYALSKTEVADIYTGVTGENVCVLEYAKELDLSGPDGNPDCKIDLYDFAVLASEWTGCGLYPVCP